MARRRVRRYRGRRYGWGERQDVPAGRKVSLLILFAIAQGLFLFSPLFKLDEIEVSGNDRLTRERILERADLEPGSYLWALSPSTVTERLLELRELKAASVSLSVPGRVHLAVQEREPAMQVASTQDPRAWFEADAEGVILGPVRGPSDLPRLRLSKPLPASRRLDPTPILVALKARTWVEGNLPAPVETWEVDDLQAVAVNTTFLGRPVKVRVGPLQSMDYKMHILRAIFDRLKSEKRAVASVDLRYSSPVVRPVVPEPAPSPTP